MDLLRALNWRYAVRQFADERICEKQLLHLLTATRMRASSYGLQPYRLVVVESEAVRRRLLPHSMGQDKVLHCSHLIVFAAQVDVGDGMVDRYMARFAEVRGLTGEELGGMSDHIKSALAAMTPAQRLEWARQQAYIALGNLLTCAALMGIDSCPITGIETEGYDRELGLAEEGLATAVICAIGRRHPQDSNARLEKVRFPHREMVKVI